MVFSVTTLFFNRDRWLKIDLCSVPMVGESNHERAPITILGRNY